MTFATERSVWQIPEATILMRSSPSFGSLTDSFTGSKLVGPSGRPGRVMMALVCGIDVVGDYVLWMGGLGCGMGRHDSCILHTYL